MTTPAPGPSVGRRLSVPLPVDADSPRTASLREDEPVTDEPAAFLRARLEDDERIAREAAAKRGGGEWTASRDPGDMVAVTGRYRPDEQGFPDLPVIVDPDANETSEHIARHDPARELREVEVKRRRLARHVPERRDLTLTDDTGATSLEFYVCTWCTPNRLIDQGQAVVEWPCPDVRDDVAAYADHPDYREEWRPQS